MLLDMEMMSGVLRDGSGTLVHFVHVYPGCHCWWRWKDSTGQLPRSTCCLRSSRTFCKSFMCPSCWLQLLPCHFSCCSPGLWVNMMKKLYKCSTRFVHCVKLVLHENQYIYRSSYLRSTKSMIILHMHEY